MRCKAGWQPIGNIAKRAFSRRARGRSVSLGFELDVPLPAVDVWSRIARLEEFVCLDPFHCRVTLMRPAPGVGVDMVIEHAVLGIHLLRFGRILRWREGEGYAFSDMSRRGRRHGFPHVFFVRLVPFGEDRCRLTIEVRGRWTLPLVPARLGMIWLRWVANQHARILQKSL